MKKIILIGFYFFQIIVVRAQGNFSEAIHQGDSLFNIGKYKIAINKYFAAEAFDPTKKEIVKDKLSKVFEKIESLRIEAEKAKKETEKAKIEALQSAEESKKQAEIARKAQKETEEQKQRITKARDGFRLILLAKQKVEKDPTIALRLAQAALDKDRDSLIVEIANQIYQNHAFYKTIIDVHPKSAANNITVVSPNGDKILTGSISDSVKIWDSQGKLLTILKGNTQGMVCATFSDAGDLVVIAFSNGAIGLWESAGEFLKKFDPDNGLENKRPFCIALSPDKKTVAIGLTGQIKLLNLETGNVKLFSGHRKEVSSVAFSFEGDRILSGGVDSTAKLWDLNGNIITEYFNDNGPSGVNAVAFSPNGQDILTGYYDGTAILWNVNGGGKSDSFDAAGMIKSIAFSPDGYIFALGAMNGIVNLYSALWDGKYHTEPLGIYKGNTNSVTSIAFTIDGGNFISGTSDGKARTWNVDGANLINFNNADIAKREETYSIAASPDGTKVLIASGKTARTWTPSGKPLNEFKGHTDKILCTIFSGSGRKILTGSADKTAKLWDTNGKLISELNGHHKSVSTVAFSPDENKILTGSSDSSVRLWNSNGTLNKEFTGFGGKILCVAFSEDGTKILVGSSDGIIKKYSSAGVLLNQFKLLKEDFEVVSMAFSPNGNNIIASITKLRGTRGEKNMVGLWNSDGTYKQTLQQYTSNEADSIFVFSPDGKKIISAGTPRKGVQLWDSEGVLMWDYYQQDQGIYNMTFSENGKKIIAITSDFFQVWNCIMTMEELLASDTIDQLTESQKKEFGIK